MRLCWSTPLCSLGYFGYESLHLKFRVHLAELIVLCVHWVPIAAVPLSSVSFKFSLWPAILMNRYDQRWMYSARSRVLHCGSMLWLTRNRLFQFTRWSCMYDLNTWRCNAWIYEQHFMKAIAMNIILHTTTKTYFSYWMPVQLSIYTIQSGHQLSSLLNCFVLHIHWCDVGTGTSVSTSPWQRMDVFARTQIPS